MVHRLRSGPSLACGGPRHGHDRVRGRLRRGRRERLQPKAPSALPSSGPRSRIISAPRATEEAVDASLDLLVLYWQDELAEEGAGTAPPARLVSYWNSRAGRSLRGREAGARQRAVLRRHRHDLLGRQMDLRDALPARGRGGGRLSARSRVRPSGPAAAQGRLGLRDDHRGGAERRLPRGSLARSRGRGGRPSDRGGFPGAVRSGRSMSPTHPARRGSTRPPTGTRTSAAGRCSSAARTARAHAFGATGPAHLCGERSGRE